MLLHGPADGAARHLGPDGGFPAQPARRCRRYAARHSRGHRPLGDGGTNPPLIYDYYGFPESTYRLQYPAPGSPALAAEVAALLRKAGFPTAEDAERGFDHGVFIPFLVAFPEASIPVVELSVRKDLDPAAHLAIGRALAPLREDGVLILATGMSYHNLRGFFSDDPRASAASLSLLVTVACPR